MGRLAIANNQFYYDGEEAQILSGAIHYFRVVPEYWQNRLSKLKSCGLNAIETYVPWNLHEPSPDTYCFSGLADLEKFIEIAHELNLRVIIRPGPYICSEWDFGGLPAWLLTIPGIKLRCSNKPYLERVDAWFDELLPRIAKYQSTNGGPVIAMQVENEYGSYGNDLEYLKYLRDGMVRRGIDVLLFTSDGPTDRMLQCGTIPDVLKTVNFGSRADEAFEKLDEYQQGLPHMCMEFWNGWFDHWGEEHHTRPPDDAAATLDEILSRGASVNFYMFHGGTNFGFMNGANYQDTYQPTITSYDYDSALDEAGNKTAKFDAFYNVISKHVKPDSSTTMSSEPERAQAYGTAQLSERVDLFAVLEQIKPTKSVWPLTMEELGHYYGYVLYRTRVSGPRRENTLTAHFIRDRGLVFINGEYRGILYRNNPTDGVTVDIPEHGATIDILVENLGRINYGPMLGESKGIVDKILLSNVSLSGWDHFPVPLDDVDAVFDGRAAETGAVDVPAYYRGTFVIDDQMDTYVDTDGWTKGSVFVNGFNLGRYWDVGPQRTLYLPGPLLVVGANTIVVFELEGTEATTITFRDTPILDKLIRSPASFL